ncbi:MAG: alginate lyase family protein [Planctomycetota bacterium]
MPERTYIWNAESLALAQRLVAAGDPELVAARDAIVQQADLFLSEPVIPITDGKGDPKVAAPSGDPREYISIGPYWWPNPDTDDGLPFVRRDGEVNPDRSKYDADKLAHFGRVTTGLALGYLVTGDERYAARAADHLRTWFVDPASRMHPRMEFAQFVPGVTERGRKSGVIETLRIRFVADAMEIIAQSDHWSPEDDAEARRWYTEYLDWLLNSDLGKAELATANNHATWALAQCVQYALVTGQRDLATKLALEGRRIIEEHIESDGRQPEELTRTIALHYCGFNLRGLLDLAVYAETLDVDLLGYTSPSGGSIAAALEFVEPYMTDRKDWPYQQIRPNSYERYNQLFRMAFDAYDDPSLGRVIDDLPPLEARHLWMAYVWPRPLTARAK